MYGELRELDPLNFKFALLQHLLHISRLRKNDPYTREFFDEERVFMDQNVFDDLTFNDEPGNVDLHNINVTVNLN